MSTLDDLTAQPPASLDDLIGAADWLTEYGDGDEDDPTRAEMLRAAGFLMREVKRRERDHRRRDLAARLAAKHNLSPTDPRVVRAAKEAVR